MSENKALSCASSVTFLRYLVTKSRNFCMGTHVSSMSVFGAFARRQCFRTRIKFLDVPHAPPRGSSPLHPDLVYAEILMGKPADDVRGVSDAPGACRAAAHDAGGVLLSFAENGHASVLDAPGACRAAAHDAGGVLLSFAENGHASVSDAPGAWRCFYCRLRKIDMRLCRTRLFCKL